MKFHRVDETEVLKYHDRVELKVIYTTSFGDQRDCYFLYDEHEEEAAIEMAKAILYGDYEVQVEE